MAGGRMTKFKLQEISAVDRPAQFAARAVIMKRAGVLDRARDVSRSAIRLVVSKLGGLPDASMAETFEEALAQTVNWDNYWKLQDGLRTSVESIIRDDALDAAAKSAMLKTSLSQYSAAVMLMFGDEGLAKNLTDVARQDVICDEMTKFGYRFSEKGDIEKSTGSDSMGLKEIAKSLGLPETATEAEVTAAIQKMEDDRKLQKAINALSNEHRAYFDQVEKGEDKAAFLAKASDKERDTFIKAFPPKKKKPDPADDDEDDADMQKLQKRAEAAGFVILKREDHEGERLRIAKLEERNERAEFSKRAEPLTYIGKSDEIGGLLYDVSKLDATKGPVLAKALEEKFTALNTVIHKGAMFSEIGGGHRMNFGKAAEEVDSLAADLMKTEKGLSVEMARAEVRKRNPELKTREQAESKRSRAA